jgi:hypothetical protein
MADRGSGQRRTTLDSEPQASLGNEAGRHDLSMGAEK